MAGESWFSENFDVRDMTEEMQQGIADMYEIVQPADFESVLDGVVTEVLTATRYIAPLFVTKDLYPSFLSVIQGRKDRKMISALELPVDLEFGELSGAGLESLKVQAGLIANSSIVVFAPWVYEADVLHALRREFSLANPGLVVKYAAVYANEELAILPDYFGQMTQKAPILPWQTEQNSGDSSLAPEVNPNHFLLKNVPRWLVQSAGTGSVAEFTIYHVSQAFSVVKRIGFRDEEIRKYLYDKTGAEELDKRISTELFRVGIRNVQQVQDVLAKIRGGYISI